MIKECYKYRVNIIEVNFIYVERFEELLFDRKIIFYLLLL